ncbi:MAG: ketoacyl-ACP synthase III, partial [Armatimonadetes bacterium]|nr:ketoacyl-ACP synthase III [Armatimonadota bacterium]MDW8122997.1 beta-ketoacyl-ACP synthase III [Armatimonadota bacterium]
MTAIGILGLGSYLPEKVLTNQDLEKLVDTSDDWIRTRTGIRERRIASQKETTTLMAIQAAKAALRTAQTDPAELDLIIVATVTPDYFFPATACLVQEALRAPSAPAFDLLVGCTGFVYGLALAESFLKARKGRKALVIGSESLSRLVNWQDRKTCVLFGDGAGAAVLGPVEEGRGFLSYDLGSDGSGAPLLSVCALPPPEPALRFGAADASFTISMNGNEVFRFAVRVMEESTKKALEKANLTVEELDLIVPHQANSRIIDAAVRRLGVPTEKVVMNVERYGNTSAASIPIALEEAFRTGRLKAGDLVVLVAF